MNRAEPCCTGVAGSRGRPADPFVHGERSLTQLLGIGVTQQTDVFTQVGEPAWFEEALHEAVTNATPSQVVLITTSGEIHTLSIDELVAKVARSEGPSNAV